MSVAGVVVADLELEAENTSCRYLRLLSLFDDTWKSRREKVSCRCVELLRSSTLLVVAIAAEAVEAYLGNL